MEIFWAMQLIEPAKRQIRKRFFFMSVVFLTGKYNELFPIYANFVSKTHKIPQLWKNEMYLPCWKSSVS